MGAPHPPPASAKNSLVFSSLAHTMRRNFIIPKNLAAELQRSETKDQRSGGRDPWAAVRVKKNADAAVMSRRAGSG
jgi:hypothetical protein